MVLIKIIYTFSLFQREMARASLFVFAALSLFGLISSEKYKFQINHFDVPLDHFTFVSNQTFKIR